MTLVEVPWSVEEFIFRDELFDVELFVLLKCHAAEPMTYDYPGCPVEFELRGVRAITEAPDGKAESWHEAIKAWVQDQADRDTGEWCRICERANELCEEDDHYEPDWRDE